jgi:hypothetical protein
MDAEVVLSLIQSEYTASTGKLKIHKIIRPVLDSKLYALRTINQIFSSA